MGSQDSNKQLTEEKYQKAVTAYKQKSADMDSLYKMFSEVRDYKSASKYLEVIEKERTYRKLVKAYKSENCNWIETADGFKSLGEYKKAEEYYSDCVSRADAFSLQPAYDGLTVEAKRTHTLNEA